MRKSFKTLNTIPKYGIFPMSQALFQQRAYPKVYFDLALDSSPIGRVVFQLFDNVTPKTVENFLSFTNGTNPHGLNYQKSQFTRVLPMRGIWGGEFQSNQFYSLYGKKFPDENFSLSHDRAGLLTTANIQGQNSNDSRFIITLAPAEWLNRRSVVFGEVIKGMELLKQVEKYGQSSGQMSKSLSVEDCGELKGQEYNKYQKEEKFDIWAYHPNH